MAYLPLGRANAVIALIGCSNGAIVAAVFMELRHGGAQSLVFAGGGLFWLGTLLWLEWIGLPNPNLGVGGKTWVKAE
ncbi:hypothetical protein QA641_14910 [Bradyrhizobium sp. CB1650]|uniref:hypothetical protein n=1 Tax=Bradyrhizobium sp. CB1650 TaxID=3039153 RepID=UPI0024354416|nr:hypothetical protein [Bradyrhizobium sp. CB1650]WGD55070.1 hypothetical protein QA641_14910 [Bradyrhizobium sp. CB1650]